MPISGNIKRVHILNAAIHIDKFGVPFKNQGRKYFLKIGTIAYPIIYIISVANIYGEGFYLEHDSNDFNSVQAKQYFEELGFEMIEK